MTKVKICGMTNLEDALVAVEAGADLLGFIFYEPSPRYVTPETVREIVAGVKGNREERREEREQGAEERGQQRREEREQGAGGRGMGTEKRGEREQRAGSREQGAGGRKQGSRREQEAREPGHNLRESQSEFRNPNSAIRIPQSEIESPQSEFRNPQSTIVQFVGVFVNSPPERVRQIIDFCQLDAVQLHGEESPGFVASFEGRAFKALRPKSQADAEVLIPAYLPCPSTVERPCFLIDAYHPTLYGGTGHVTDWTMAAGIARRYPIMVAGSLSPANVAQAIRAVRPWGVDVSSGVEAEKGRKDHDKVRAFVKASKHNNELRK